MLKTIAFKIGWRTSAVQSATYFSSAPPPCEGCGREIIVSDEVGARRALAGEEAASSTTPINVYLYAGDQIIKNVTMGYFYYQDSLGNTSHVTDAAGQLLERYTYTAFGTPTFYNAGGGQIAASTYGIRHLFQEQLWTQETGLNDYRNRVEFPVMGVFLQPDPIGFKGDAANLYRFCNNNAVNRSDPLGLMPSIGIVEIHSGYSDGITGPDGARMASGGSDLAQQYGPRQNYSLAQISSQKAARGTSSAAYSLAADVVSKINPDSIKYNREKILLVYKDPNTGELRTTKPVTTTELGQLASFRVPAGALPLVIAHTHGDYTTGPENALVRTDKAHDTYNSDTFSRGSNRSDIPLLRDFHSSHPSLLGGVLGTPSGRILKYDIRSDKISDITP